MKQNARLLPLALLSLSLMRCALTDHYELASDQGGATGTAGTASSGSAGGALSGTAGGTVSQGGSAGSLPNSVCSPMCSGPQQCCAAACVDTTTDAQNCGSCGNACDAGRECAASACSTGWLSMAAPPTGFVGRTHPATVAMGRSVFIWGGRDSAGNALNTGAIYSPATDSWVLVNQTGAPTPRSLATAVWTGNIVVVFGGVDATGNNLLRDAYAYDPNAKTWTTLPPAVTQRCRALGVWDGTRAIVWGGTDVNNLPIAGADRFDLTNWTTSSTPGDPGALLSPAVGFDGSTLYLQGGLLNGNARQDEAFSYATNTDGWTALNPTPPPRSNGFGAWDGTHFVVWGGRDDANLRNDGEYLSGSTWVAMSATGAPSARLL
ncbi:MAG TPA: kelch repeat-containing protein, partial [Polyangiaceae bacterium]|nr:kelch repeat-containing protein [Polyangiaceae bacterium]